jgi:hypothetical protein
MFDPVPRNVTPWPSAPSMLGQTFHAAPGTPRIQDWHAFKFEKGSAPALEAATKCLVVVAVKADGGIAAG